MHVWELSTKPSITKKLKQSMVLDSQPPLYFSCETQRDFMPTDKSVNWFIVCTAWPITSRQHPDLDIPLDLDTDKWIRMFIIDTGGAVKKHNTLIRWEWVWELKKPPRLRALDKGTYQLWEDGSDCCNSYESLSAHIPCSIIWMSYVSVHIDPFSVSKHCSVWCGRGLAGGRKSPLTAS